MSKEETGDSGLDGLDEIGVGGRDAYAFGGNRGLAISSGSVRVWIDRGWNGLRQVPAEYRRFALLCGLRTEAMNNCTSHVKGHAPSPLLLPPCPASDSIAGISQIPPTLWLL